MQPSQFLSGHRPDFDRFVSQVTRKGPPGPVPLAEYLVDWPVIEEVSGVKLAFRWTEGLPARATVDPGEREKAFDSAVRSVLGFCRAVGMDYLPVELGVGLLTYQAVATGTGGAGGRQAWWFLDPRGSVGTWEDLERVAWPPEQGTDYTLLDKACRAVPDGMKVMVKIEGVFENASGLTGMIGLFTLLHDNPDLVDAIIERVADILTRQVEVAVQHDEVGGIWMGEDLGFNTGTFVNPDSLRRAFFPAYRRVIDLAHKAGRVFLLHSCGNLERIMDDLIGLGVDAKHSFEDKIMPVEEVYRRWGSRIGVLGGVDMDLLARGSEDEVRCRTRQILEVCGLHGGYAVGSGNSVADYVRLGNYLAMIEEARRWNREHFGVDG